MSQLGDKGADPHANDLVVTGQHWRIEPQLPLSGSSGSG